MKLAICELYHHKIHGYDQQNSSTNINGQFLVIEKVKKDEIMCDLKNVDSTDTSNVFIYSNTRKRMLLMMLEHLDTDDIIRNYKHIILYGNYHSPQIVECYNLDGGEKIAVLKTIWLRLIQRAWKKVFQQRLNVIKNRLNPKAIRQREITGKWSKDCVLPSLTGMLNGVNK